MNTFDVYLSLNPLKTQNVLLIFEESMMQVKKKLLDIVRDKVRLKHYSMSTEKTYVHWIKHYIFTHIVAELNKGMVVSPLDM